MAGRGRAPKPKAQRRNRAEPQRGDWVTLPSDEVEDQPGLPMPAPKGGYCVQAKREWAWWWASPMAHMWTDSDRSTLEVLIRMIHEWWDSPTASMASQIRQYKDNLGLTPKGRQDRRWQLPSENAESAEVRPLRAVAGDKRPLPVDPNG